MSNSAKSSLRAAFALGVGLWLALVLALPVAAAEVIRSFSSNVILQTDGSVHVIESIEVTAEGDKIKRGIYRDIPTIQTIQDENGNQTGKLRSNLSVLGVTKNGVSEPWFTEGITNGMRIYIGDADVFLSRGVYRYTIEYTMMRMARRFDTYDELFWNATGNFWDFPINQASATITLPEGAVIENVSGYTGPFGSIEQAVTIVRQADNKITVRATRGLNAYEGMSVAASFQKGVLDEPTTVSSALDYLSDHRAEILPGIAAFIVLLYNLFAWDAVGRDPKKGTIIPLFHPPEGFSAPLVHYVNKLGWKNSGWLAFTAGLVDLAVRGHIKLGKEGKDNTFTYVKGGNSELPAGERELLDYIKSREIVTVNKSTGRTLQNKKTQFTTAVENGNKNVYFKNNAGYVILGFALTALCILALVLTDALDPEWLIVAIFGGVFLGVPLLILRSVWSGGGIGRIFGLVVLGFMAVNIGGGALAFFASAFTGFDVAAFATVSIVAIAIIFAALMRAPTAEGRRVMDQIDGFKMYLETAEKNRLNFVAEPEMSVPRFESILPFAIALGVEKPWTERFESDLARNAVSDVRGAYHPVWTSSSFNSGSLSRDVASFASGMSAAMIAAQPASSSSSGSGGGGSSGGGGGGGGGGGW